MVPLIPLLLLLLLLPLFFLLLLLQHLLLPLPLLLLRPDAAPWLGDTGQSSGRNRNSSRRPASSPSCHSGCRCRQRHFLPVVVFVKKAFAVIPKLLLLQPPFVLLRSTSTSVSSTDPHAVTVGRSAGVKGGRVTPSSVGSALPPVAAAAATRGCRRTVTCPLSLAAVHLVPLRLAHILPHLRLLLGRRRRRRCCKPLAQSLREVKDHHFPITRGQLRRLPHQLPLQGHQLGRRHPAALLRVQLQPGRSLGVPGRVLHHQHRQEGGGGGLRRGGGDADAELAFFALVEGEVLLVNGLQR
mmetsp:Transcript_10689/g.26218  ORF Transcript_10689/g.26218 Transcript_10689/m.26218 type:complete len:298 (-) Transcript_10689:60-953(-)